jgi:hypothetical protein
VLPLTLHGPAGHRVTLRYRHVNQAEPYEELAMTRVQDGWTGEIPVSYTDSPFDLQYFFDVHAGGADAWLYPGFDEDLANRPYHVVTAEPSDSSRFLMLNADVASLIAMAVLAIPSPHPWRS